MTSQLYHAEKREGNFINTLLKVSTFYIFVNIILLLKVKNILLLASLTIFLLLFAKNKKLYFVIVFCSVEYKRKEHENGRTCQHEIYIIMFYINSSSVACTVLLRNISGIILKSILK